MPQMKAVPTFALDTPDGVLGADTLSSVCKKKQ
jgi:hypothetical protein